MILLVVVIRLEAVFSARAEMDPLPQNHKFKAVTSFPEI